MGKKKSTTVTYSNLENTDVFGRMRRATMILPVLLLVAAMGTMAKAEGMEEFSPEVKISQGSLRGIIRKAESDRTFYSFRGIPYAKTPVGPLRFKVRHTTDYLLAFNSDISALLIYVYIYIFFCKL